MFQVLRRAEQLGSGLLYQGLTPSQEQFVGIFAQNRPEVQAAFLTKLEGCCISFIHAVSTTSFSKQAFQSLVQHGLKYIISATISHKDFINTQLADALKCVLQT